MTDQTARPALFAELLASAPRIQALLETYQLQDTALTRSLEDAQTFSVRVPMVGAFSSGKTSLLNALLGNKFFAVEINPETSLPVELRYGQPTRFVGDNGLGLRSELQAEQVLAQQFDALLPAGWVEATIDAPLLARFPLLTLVDMPGWDSGIGQHSQAIDHYLERSLAYVIVVSAEEGNLRNSLRLFLEELAIRKLPALLVIGKSDKKSADDLAAVEAKIHGEVSALLGAPPLATAVVSARKKQTDGFVNALCKLEEKVDERFWQAVILPVDTLLQQLTARITHLNLRENLQADALEAAGKTLQQETQQFNQRLAQQDRRLEDDLHAAGQRIQQQVQARLHDNLTHYAHQLVEGSGLESSLSQVVRLAMAEAVTRELTPVFKDYMHTVVSDLTQTIHLDAKLNSGNPRDAQTTDESASNLASTLLGALPMLIPQVGWPYKILTLISPLVLDLLKGFFSSRNRELEAARQLESARGQLMNQIFPSVMQQVALQVQTLINEQGGQIKRRVAQEAADYIARQQDALAQLQQQSQLNAAEFDQQRLQYQQHLSEVHQLQALFARPMETV